MFKFHREHGSKVSSSLISKMSELYSSHYGIWGQNGRRPGECIRLNPEQIKRWLTEDSVVVWAEALGSLVGYAIALDLQLPAHGKVAWVTQLVVHKDHRKVDVGK